MRLSKWLTFPQITAMNYYYFFTPSPIYLPRHSYCVVGLMCNPAQAWLQPLGGSESRL